MRSEERDGGEKTNDGKTRLRGSSEDLRRLASNCESVDDSRGSVETRVRSGESRGKHSSVDLRGGKEEVASDGSRIRERRVLLTTEGSPLIPARVKAMTKGEEAAVPVDLRR